MPGCALPTVAERMGSRTAGIASPLFQNVKALTTMSKADQQIWAIDTPPNLPRAGVVPVRDLDAAVSYLRKHNPRIVTRGPAESDPTMKQIIPYVVLLSPNNKRVFAYQRTKDGGETRLHGQYSIGVGGHLEAQDGSDDDLNFLDLVIAKGYDREMKEELGQSVNGARYFAFINEDETEVGSVHLGILIAITVGSSEQGRAGAVTRALEITPKEEMINSGWLLWSDVLRRRDEFELWSQLAADHLAPKGENDDATAAEPAPAAAST